MKKRKYLIISPILLVLLLTFLFYSGVLGLNDWRVGDYPVRGVDVSSYQGEIDWEVLAGQDIEFAFIKATEGSTYIDPNFKKNWEQAGKTDLKIGAYHFFSYDSGGSAQAQNFISSVKSASLPPVVDIEFYGDYVSNPMSKEDAQPILDELLQALEAHYGVKPILYATQKSYALYLKEDYSGYPLWIRNVVTKPDLPERQAWTFWQYSDRKRLKGYSGKEKFIDMNVFNGNEAEFSAWVDEHS